MSESGFDDVEISRLELAAAFMRAVRLDQATAYTKFSGRTRISEEQKSTIAQAIDSSTLIEALKETANADLPVNALAERFEEMCRRREGVMTEGLRRSVVKLLAAELWLNHTALSAPPDKLLTATVLHGAVAPELRGEFPKLPAYVVTHAMSASPIDPRRALQQIEKRVAEVSCEPEFALLARNRPSAFLEAAIGYSDLRGNLRKAQERLKRDHWTEQETTRPTENTGRER